MSIAGTRDGEALPGLQADDYMYEVGAGTIASELDDNLRGAKVGDVVEFDAVPTGTDQDPVHFRVLVKDIKEKVLPEVTDEWANDVSEFDTVEELRADLAERIGGVRKMQAQMALRDKAVLSLIDLVEDDAPEPLVNAEVQQRLQDLSMRLSAQGISAEDYLASTGKTADSLMTELQELGVQAVKADLALRALADAEDIDVTEDDLDDEIARLAERVGQKPDRVRRELERAEQVQAIRSDIRKRKALEWLVEHVELVDESGKAIERDALTLPEQSESDDIEPSDTDHSGLEEE
jgi:trigger factor